MPPSNQRANGTGPRNGPCCWQKEHTRRPELMSHTERDSSPRPANSRSFAGPRSRDEIGPRSCRVCLTVHLGSFASFSYLFRRSRWLNFRARCPLFAFPARRNSFAFGGARRSVEPSFTDNTDSECRATGKEGIDDNAVDDDVEADQEELSLVTNVEDDATDASSFAFVPLSLLGITSPIRPRLCFSLPRAVARLRACR